MTTKEHYFPKGIAAGKAFCNRDTERKVLKENILALRHTLLISPRRYGKTSLVRYAMHELKLPYGEADLFVAVDAKRIEQVLVNAVKHIVEQIAGSLEQAVNLLRAAFKSLNAQWIIGTRNIQLVLAPDRDTDPAQNVLEALSALDHLLKNKQQQAILFIDEMQELAEVAEGRGFEGAIRHVAQQTKNISFVFSGSKRHMLAKMFFDKSRPLYKLCSKIMLEKITPQHYKRHLDKFAVKQWGNEIADAVLEKIFELTECHSYYVNSLCDRLWSQSKVPTIKLVEAQWLKILHEEKLEIAAELQVLSPGQRKILIAIADGNNTELTSKQFLQIVDLSSSSVSQAVSLLVSKDYIELNEHGVYKFIDPMLKASLRYFYLR